MELEAKWTITLNISCTCLPQPWGFEEITELSKKTDIRWKLSKKVPIINQGAFLK